MIPESQICTIAASTALALPTDERAALVLRLAESVDDQQDADAEDAWAAEVAARMRAFEPELPRPPRLQRLSLRRALDCQLVRG